MLWGNKSFSRFYHVKMIKVVFVNERGLQRKDFFHRDTELLCHENVGP